ncbi:globin-like isoform X3 [Dermacentor albipictus]|uniref:globin-like isoform X3 n=1 Tax=Dermacentor albipictus TaxID=60249 RepID=UPI0031FC25F5
MGNSLRRVATSSGRTGLTYRERKHVRDTWQAFCRAKPDYGVLIFVEFFQRYPSYLQLFEPFGDLPLKDLVCNHRFRAHGSAVGHQFTAVVDTLDEPDVMIELIRKNAVKHALKPGVKAEHFESLLHVMLETMQTRCPEHFTPDVVVAWTKLFDMAFKKEPPGHEREAAWPPGAECHTRSLSRDGSRRASFLPLRARECATIPGSPLRAFTRTRSIRCGAIARGLYAGSHGDADGRNVPGASKWLLSQ